MKEFMLLAWGIGVGLLLALGFVNMDISKYTLKSKVDKKETIQYDRYYVQYSAVRKVLIPTSKTIFK